MALPTTVAELRKLFAENGGVRSWGNVVSLRTGASDLDANDLSVGDESHRRALLALTSAERRQLFGGTRLVDKVHAIALALAESDRTAEALTLFDDLVEVANEYSLEVYISALQLAPKDRAVRYLERALTYAQSQTELYVAASQLRLRLGDHSGADALLLEAIRHGHDPASLGERIPAGASADPHWVMPVALLALRELSNDGVLDRLDCDTLPGLLAPAATTEWYLSWSGRSEAPKLRPFAHDGAGGYVCFSLVLAGQPLEAQPIAYFGSEGEHAVLTRDFADFLAVLALGIGPGALAERGAKAKGRKLKAVGALVAEHYPAAVARSLEAIVADARSAR